MSRLATAVFIVEGGTPPNDKVVVQYNPTSFNLEKAITHTYGLKEVDTAIQAVAGKMGPDVIHVSVAPWKDAA